MTLVQAQAVAIDARTVFDDPAADARVWAEVLEALDAASPIVEDGGLGRAFLEMHGIAGDPARLDRRGARRARGASICPVRVGFGPNRFVAHAATWRGDGLVCEGDPAAFLAPLPLELALDEASRATRRARRRASGCGCSA